MSGARSVVCEMDGVKWMAWDQRDKWCMVVRDEWWGISGERWVWWEMNVYMRRYVRRVRGVVWDEMCVYVRCCVRWVRWVVWNGGERWMMSDEVRDDVRWMRKWWCENGCPEYSLHTARRQTRMPGRHQRKIFASPIGTATPNTVYTQQGAKPACQDDINAKFSQLLAGQLPRTTFTHSKLPNLHGRKPATQNFRISYWHSHPERRSHTASCQTRMARSQQHKIFPAHWHN